MSRKLDDEERSARVLLLLPAPLDRAVRQTAVDLGLSNQQTMRLSLERGLVVLNRQLKTLNRR